MNTKVSILMPVHNAEQTLPASVASVVNQRFDDWELLIVDDASIDGSGAVAQRLAAEDTRIRVLTLARNAGAAGARNHGLAHAQGRYIAFLDADDLWHPEKLFQQIPFMQEQRAALSFTSYARMAPSNALIERVVVPAYVDYATLLKRNVMGCLTVIYDSQILGKVEMPALKRQQDFALWLRLAKVAEGAHGLDAELAIYRVGRGTLSGNKAAGARDIWRIYRASEGLGLAASLWYFGHYAWYGLRHRLFQKPALGAEILDPTFGADQRLK